MAPAKVSKIIIDDDEHEMEVIVPDEQLSLAIGRKGQNVRLASRLTGWKIDVCSEAEAEEESRAGQGIDYGNSRGYAIFPPSFCTRKDLNLRKKSPRADLQMILDVEGISRKKPKRCIARASRMSRR